MEHGRSRFFLDRRSIVWYVVNSGSPHSRIDELRTGMKYAALFIPPLPLLTGMRISQHMRLRLMRVHFVHEGIEGMEFVSWSYPSARVSRAIQITYINGQDDALRGRCAICACHGARYHDRSPTS